MDITTLGAAVALSKKGVEKDVGDLKRDVAALSEDVEGKLDGNQGAGNAGKLLGIGSDGSVVPTAPTGGGVINDAATGADTTWSSGKIDAAKQNRQADNGTFDGVDLSTIYADADALYADLAAENYDHIHVGDYWPVTLNGTYRDYGNMTCPAGVTYYTDEDMTAEAGVTSEDVMVTGMTQDTNIPGCHKPFVTIKISNVTYYVAWDDCLDYQEKTLANAIMKFEVAGINQYWRYGDSGKNGFENGKPHLLLSARDGLPHTLKMRKCNEVWEGQHIDEFTGDGSTADFTLSGTVGTIGYVWVAGTRKAYNTDYTFGNDKITFKAGKIPANGAKVEVEWCEGFTPWTGSSLYRTFNDPDHGILPLIQAADAKLFSHIYTGPNDKGMRYHGEYRNKTNQTGGDWQDRGVLFLPLEDEIWGRWIHASGGNGYCAMSQWPIYMGGRRHFAKGAGNAASRYSVWCASSTYVYGFAHVSHRGFPDSYGANNALAAAPCFLLS